ncbi:MAG: hypothetical protein ABFS39_12570 [Pseudomonadota bacterium]
MSDSLLFTCEELREIAEIHPTELEIIIEMMIEADADVCREAA